MRLTLSAALLLCGVFALADEPKTAPTKKADPPAEAKKEAKQTYTSKEGKYSIVFPIEGKVSEQSKKEKTASGDLTAYLAFVTRGEEVVYMVSHCDVTDDADKITDVEAVLDGTVTGMISGMKGTEKDTTKIKVQGQKGREVTFELPNKSGYGKARVVLVGTRLYQMLVIGKEKIPPGTDDFLQSFALTDAKKGDKPADKKEEKKEEAKLIEGKQKYASKEGKYAVEFPYKNKLEEKTQDIPVGDVKVKLHMAGFETADAAFLVSYTDYPDSVIENGNPDDILDGCVKGMLKGKTEKETTKIKVQGQKGREATFDIPGLKASGKARAVLVGNRLYQMIVIQKDDKLPGADDFLQSLTLTGVKKED